jgi:uncharacterized membrane protein YbhN (UPF0104 family)
LINPEAIPASAGRTPVSALFDVVVLFAALAAMDRTIPVRGVVVAYTLGQLISAIPILPGGGGTIEATMSAGLILTMPNAHLAPLEPVA